MKTEFFDLLSSDKTFAEQMGRMTLAAGRFESDLREYLKLFSVIVPEEKATLGNLIKELKKRKLISENGEKVLRDLKKKRNYLTHSLYDLFSERVKETIMSKYGLIEEDVVNFSEMVMEVESDIISLTKIAEKKIMSIKIGNTEDGEDILLFRP